MPILTDRPTETTIVAKGPKRRPLLRRRYRAALGLLTLLGLVGKTILIDTKAVEAVVQVVKHLHLFGF